METPEVIEAPEIVRAPEIIPIPDTESAPTLETVASDGPVYLSTEQPKRESVEFEMKSDKEVEESIKKQKSSEEEE